MDDGYGGGQLKARIFLGLEHEACVDAPALHEVVIEEAAAGELPEHDVVPRYRHPATIQRRF